MPPRNTVPRSVTGAITPTTPTVARLTAITVRNGSWAAYSSAQVPGITGAGMVTPDGAVATVSGIEADTAIVAAMPVVTAAHMRVE